MTYRDVVRNRLALGMLFLIVLLSSQVSAQTPEKVNQPAVKVGDTWVYQRFDVWKKVADQKHRYQVTRVNPDTVELSMTRDEQAPVPTLFTRELNLIAVGKTTYKPFRPSYSFPLSVGKSWQGTVDFPREDGMGETNVALSCKAVGWEKVTVPAGTFDVLRIEYSGDWNSRMLNGRSFQGRVKRIFWYSPVVRRAVREEYRDTDGQNKPSNQYDYELLEYKLVP